MYKYLTKHNKHAILSLVGRKFSKQEKLKMSNDLIIRARDVVKTYNTGKLVVPALQRVNLDVYRGEMVSIMGPSGCGKTTLLNTFSGLDEIDSGLIEIGAINLARMDDRSRTRYRAENMGFVFQFYNLLPVLTAVENVEMPLLLSEKGYTARQARSLAHQALEAVGLSAQALQLPAELSGGQRQRVTIARALVNSPAIVWADEPTGDLDSQTSQDIIDLMRRLNKDNQQTFVIVTHSIEIGNQTDRIIWMRDGSIVDDGQPVLAAQPEPSLPEIQLAQPPFAAAYRPISGD
jgi:putative ABC transport system ATP-binding protein